MSGLGIKVVHVTGYHVYMPIEQNNIKMIFNVSQTAIRNITQTDFFKKLVQIY